MRTLNQNEIENVSGGGLVSAVLGSMGILAGGLLGIPYFFDTGNATQNFLMAAIPTFVALTVHTGYVLEKSN